MKKPDPNTPAFLWSHEWRTLRMRALTMYGAKCQCCGATRATAQIHVDHIQPRKTHPHLALDILNLQVLCHACNQGKGNKDTTDWRHKNKPPDPKTTKALDELEKKIQRLERALEPTHKRLARLTQTLQDRADQIPAQERVSVAAELHQNKGQH